MKPKDKQKVAIAAVAFLVLLVGLAALNFTKFKQRRQLMSEIDRLGQQAFAAENKIKTIPELLDRRAELIATIDRYAEILPPEDEVHHLRFAETIDRYRQDTSIVVTKAEYVPIKEDEKKKTKQRFKRHRWRFKLEGTVPDFVDFMNRIENHPRFLKVDSFAIKPLGSQGAFGGDLSPTEDAAELEKAKNPKKAIELTVSTYTYYKGA